MLGLSEEFLNGDAGASFAGTAFAGKCIAAYAPFAEFAWKTQQRIMNSLKRMATVSSHRRGVNVHTLYPVSKVTKFRSRRTAKVWVKEFRASIK